MQGPQNFKYVHVHIKNGKEHLVVLPNFFDQGSFFPLSIPSNTCHGNVSRKASLRNAELSSAILTLADRNTLASFCLLPSSGRQMLNRGDHTGLIHGGFMITSISVGSPQHSQLFPPQR